MAVYRLASRPFTRPAVRAGWALVLAALCVGGVGGLSLSRTPDLGGRTAAVTVATTTADFASRAGYDAPELEALVGAAPASGTVSVTLTFDAPLSASEYVAAESYFRSQGLSVTSTVSDRLSLGLDGPAAQVGAAFSTELLAGSVGGEPVQVPAAPPSLPAGLEAEVAGVVGLSSGFTDFSFALGNATPYTPTVNPQTVTPALAREFYGLTSLYNLSGGAGTYATGLSIAVVLWGNGFAWSDIDTFLSQYYPSVFPSAHIVAYPVDGAPRPNNDSVLLPGSRMVEELTLDTEWAASMAPGATIDVVYAPEGPAPSFSPTTSDLTDALSEAVSLDPAVISMSFGTNESSDASLVSAWTPLLQQAANQGTTVLAASGDTGGDAGPGCTGGLAPEYPASDPSVIAVGGTDVSISYPLGGSTPSFSETAWNDSGGGFSSQFAAPSWQEVGSAAGPVSANGHRGMPDVSASAADNFLYFNGSADVAGGTSFATPMWGGLVTAIDAKWGHELGLFTPSLYHVGAEEELGGVGDGLVDVVGGASCVGVASAGWDVVTGWGSPRAPVLYNDLLGSFVNIALTSSSRTLAPGGSVQVTADLTNRTSGAAIPDTTVAFSFASDTDLGPCTGSFGSATGTTNATGVASATLHVPLCYLGLHALVNASVATVKLYGSAGLRLDVSLLGLAPSLQFLANPPWAYVAYSVIVGAAVVLGAWIGRPREPSLPVGSPPPAPPAPAPSAVSGSAAPAPSAPPPPAGPGPPSAEAPPSPPGGPPPPDPPT